MVENPIIKSRPSRLISVDLLRGLLIVIMALDHANYHIAQQHSTGEYWGGFFPVYTSPAHFLTRFVTHFSAPGFFFLMGLSMVLFTKSRLEQGWNKNKIRGHFMVRGLLLMVLQVLIVYLGAWSIGPTPAPLWYVGVLAALGMGMIIGIPFLDVKPIVRVVFACLFFIGMEFLTPDPIYWGRAFSNFPGTLLVYGGGQADFWVNYPLLAWVEVILLGMAFGDWLVDDPEKTGRISISVGSGFLLFFLVLRVLNGFGNIRSYQLRNWVDFLNLVKYPPSMTFILLTMGINLILLGLFLRVNLSKIKLTNPLVIFGKTPLFSYVGHIGIYLFLGRLLTPEGTSLGIMFFYWIAGLAILYWPAQWYWAYKKNRPVRSWVRFF